MLKNKARTYEFLTLFTMVIGTVIGSGIFMKNNQVLTQTGNPFISIFLWFFVGGLAVMTAYAFVQIASATKNSGNGTVSIWTKLFVNRRLASFFSVIYATFYFPICQSVFVAGFITFFFLSMNIYLSFATQLIIFLVVGPLLILMMGIINGFSPKTSKMIQVFGAIFKFIPLLIALVAGFCLIDKSGGTSAIWNGSGVGKSPHPWSASDFKFALFVRGFGPILFAFDGFIYIANAQKTAKYKDVVPKSLVAGMVFVACFYILMAISLFLGSPDGSIVELLAKIFRKQPQVAPIISNVLLMIICLFGINIFGFIGTMDLESSVDAKLIYNRRRIMSRPQAAFVQTVMASVIYIVFILLGALVSRSGWDGARSTIGTDQKVDVWLKTSTAAISGFISTLSSTASILAFMMIATILIGAIVNNFTKKVLIEPLRGFTPIALICAILLYFMVFCGVASFIQPTEVLAGYIKWIDSDGFYFTIFFIATLLLMVIIWEIQELVFKKNPFIHGFNGYLGAEDQISKAIVEGLKP